jgi:hypothetical protein
MSAARLGVSRTSGQVAFGVVITGVDTMAKMPTYWTLVEGPPTFAIGLVILLLNRRVQRDADTAAVDP